MRRLLPLLLLSGCFQPWTADGLYRCTEGSCPEGMTCDDGVCCRSGGTPDCPTLVPTSGRCSDGSTPRSYYADSDEDGFGNAAVARQACSRPVLDHWVADNTDCDDTGAAAHPGASEICDGRDNDCDGVFDDGLTPQKPFFRDTDGDGYGVLTDSVMACDKPPGYALMSGDCAPMDNARYPGAVELCNGLDDDCNNQNDDNVSVGTGGSCADAGFGECAAGTLGCVGGKIACRPTKVPAKDICNGLDDDCDGTPDDQPDCGGPDMLLAAGALIGARDTGSAVQGQATPTQCFGRTIGSGESWSPPMWSGSSDNFHVWYAEAPGTSVWDLSKAGLKFHLQFTTTMVRPATIAWNQFNQPIVLLCNADPTKFSRYRPLNATLMTAAAANVNTDMPIGGGNGWLLAQPGVDLTQVKRIEVIVEPTDNNLGPTMPPSFTATFNNSTGFKP